MKSSKTGKFIVLKIFLLYGTHVFDIKPACMYILYMIKFWQISNFVCNMRIKLIVDKLLLGKNSTFYQICQTLVPPVFHHLR